MANRFTDNRRLPVLVPYAGRSNDDLARYTGMRRAMYSRRSWFVELWVNGRYIGLAR